VKHATKPAPENMIRKACSTPEEDQRPISSAVGGREQEYPRFAPGAFKEAWGRFRVQREDV
jgi:hypothetical protein